MFLFFVLFCCFALSLSAEETGEYSFEQNNETDLLSPYLVPNGYNSPKRRLEFVPSSNISILKLFSAFFYSFEVFLTGIYMLKADSSIHYSLAD